MVGEGKLAPLKRQAESEGWAAWIRNERDERAVLDGCKFDPGRAQHVFDFFEQFLRQSEGRWVGKPLTLLDWQRWELIGPLFGWVKPNGRRLYRKSWCEVAKKNGKSTLAAGVGLYLTVADGEAAAEVYSAATSRKQAGEVHDEAIRMVRRSPQLMGRLKINETTKTIFDSVTYSKYAALASDSAHSEGPNIHGLIGDEMHVWKGRAFFDSLIYGDIARTQPIFFFITTAGLVDPGSIGYQEHLYALDVMTGQKLDPELLVYIRAAEVKDDILDPETHRKANPSYGDIIDPEEMMRAAKTASQKMTARVSFCRYRLNIWGEELEGYIGTHRWQQCDAEFEEDDLIGQPCWGGLDLSAKVDLCAWALLFPGETWRALIRLWAPQDTAARREHSEGVPYLTWAQDGHLMLTPGEVIDYSYILDQIKTDAGRYDIRDVGADPWNLEAFRQQALEEIENLEIVEIQQTMKYLGLPTKELEALVLGGHFEHPHNPCMQWMVGNVKLMVDGNGNTKPHKRKSKDRIDGVSALLNALARAIDGGGGDVSIYESQGFDVL